MVVDDFYVVGIAIAPHEAHSELLVDPNGVLTIPITSKRLEVITRSKIR
jgi:hypothetical protein